MAATPAPAGGHRFSLRLSAPRSGAFRAGSTAVLCLSRGPPPCVRGRLVPARCGDEHAAGSPSPVTPRPRPDRGLAWGRAGAHFSPGPDPQMDAGSRKPSACHGRGRRLLPPWGHRQGSQSRGRDGTERGPGRCRGPGCQHCFSSEKPPRTTSTALRVSRATAFPPRFSRVERRFGTYNQKD